MDFSRYTSAQLHIMHQTASDDACRAILLAESKSLEMSSAGDRHDAEGFAAAHAEFCVLMAQADDHRAYSRQVYNEIARRMDMPGLPVLPGVPTLTYAGGRTGNGTRYCRTCGFTDCPSLTEGGGCPRWPARDEYTSLCGQAGPDA